MAKPPPLPLAVLLPLLLLLATCGPTAVAAQGESLSQLVKSLRDLAASGALSEHEIDAALDAEAPKQAARALLGKATAAQKPPPMPPRPAAQKKKKKRGDAMSRFDPGPPGPQRDLFMSLWMTTKPGQRGDADGVRKALAAGADTEFIAPGSKGQTALMMAVTMSGDSELIEALLEGGADLATVDEDGYTLLDAAAFQGRHNAVIQLLEAGADASKLSRDGWGAAHRAANGAAPRYAEIVELLLQHGVSPNLVDSDGLPMVLHARTAQSRQVLVDAGACIPDWFTKDDVAASCREDENCGDVPNMSGNPDVFGSGGSCDERLGSIVAQVPRHLASQLLGDLCPCQCGHWVAPPVCDPEVLGGKTEADGRAAWASLSDRRTSGPLPIPPEGLAEAMGQKGVQMPKEVKMDL
jgi:hypothetical protein